MRATLIDAQILFQTFSRAEAIRPALKATNSSHPVFEGKGGGQPLHTFTQILLYPASLIMGKDDAVRNRQFFSHNSLSEQWRPDQLLRFTRRASFFPTGGGDISRLNISDNTILPQPHYGYGRGGTARLDRVSCKCETLCVVIWMCLAGFKLRYMSIVGNL